MTPPPSPSPRRSRSSTSKGTGCLVDSAVVAAFSESAGRPRPSTRTRTGSWSRPGPAPWQDLLLRSGDETFALRLLARELAGAAHRLRLLAGRALGRLFIEPPLLHLAEDALALHLLLQDPESLVDVVVAHEHLQGMFPSSVAMTAAGLVRRMRSAGGA